MRVLAGDIGGTKTLLAVAEVKPGERGSAQVEVLQRRRYDSPKYPGLASLCRAFLAELGGPLPRAAGFGIAGPVVDGRCQATNLPWIIDAAELLQELSLSRVRLVNDFHALTLGIASLPPERLATLNQGTRDPGGPWAVIGAGTGLGEAISILGNDGHRQILATEGGHSDFAPRNELEIGVLRFLLKRHGHGHVSWERLVSGEGLVNLCEALAELQGLSPPPAVAQALQGDRGNAPAAITAASAQDPLCRAVVELFVGLYGSEAGNLALKTLPTGGVFLGGGIAPRLLPALQDGRFLAAFTDKGRMRPLLEKMPVQVVLGDDAGLLGAASLAAQGG